MKKFGTIVLSGALALAMAGCASQKKPETAVINPPAPAPTPDQFGTGPGALTPPPAAPMLPAPVDLEPTAAAPEPAPLHRTRPAAPRTAAPTAAAHPTGHKYVVKQGDSLAKIAKTHYGAASTSNVQKIVAANPSLKKNPNLIKIGQVLVLP